MQRISKPIAKSAQSLEISSPTNSPMAANRLTTKQADSIMESVADLVTPAYRPKYFKALYRIGPQRFVDLAYRARSGKMPQHLFRHLIDME